MSLSRCAYRIDSRQYIIFNHADLPAIATNHVPNSNSPPIRKQIRPLSRHHGLMSPLVSPQTLSCPSLVRRHRWSVPAAPTTCAMWESVWRHAPGAGQGFPHNVPACHPQIAIIPRNKRDRLPTVPGVAGNRLCDRFTSKRRRRLRLHDPEHVFSDVTFHASVRNAVFHFDVAMVCSAHCFSHFG